MKKQDLGMTDEDQSRCGQKEKKKRKLGLLEDRGVKESVLHNVGTIVPDFFWELAPAAAASRWKATSHHRGHPPPQI